MSRMLVARSALRAGVPPTLADSGRVRAAPNAMLALQNAAGNHAVRDAIERRRLDTFKVWGSAGGRTGLNLDLTVSVTNTTATTLQIIQTFMGTRRSDGVQVGSYSWKWKGKTWDSFVDGGKESPYVKLSGNPPAHATKPYYLTTAEAAAQVAFDGKNGTVRVTDTPGAVALHDEAYFETAVVAVDHAAAKKDKILTAFQWGWTGTGTKEQFGKGTKIAGTPSGVQFIGSVTPGFKNIVAHDYPRYDFE